MHSQHFVKLPGNTDMLRTSFMPKTLDDWNSLPAKCINKIEVSEDPTKTFADIVKGWAKC